MIGRGDFGNVRALKMGAVGRDPGQIASQCRLNSHQSIWAGLTYLVLFNHRLVEDQFEGCGGSQSRGTDFEERPSGEQDAAGGKQEDKGKQCSHKISGALHAFV